jgi:glycosyltransferase involved in cell wall biosynthesis
VLRPSLFVRDGSGTGLREMPAVSNSQSRKFLLDVSRLIWRIWRRRLPTGIDRVCLEYVERLGSRSQAVVQFKGSTFVLSPSHSDRLFFLLRNPARCSRANLLNAALRALPTATRAPPSRDMFYLNVGHTGLDEPALPSWIAKFGLHAIYLVHDLIPLTHPHYCRAGEGQKHARRIQNVLASARGVIVNSHDTLTELSRFATSVDRKMPAAVTAWIAGNKVAARIQPKSSDRPYFVTVGTIEIRKNHPILLDVWERLVRSMGPNAPELLVIGQRGWKAEATFRRLDNLGPIAGHVREITDCDDQELASWIAGARALLMPSFVEGFGLPVIEALDLGTPVIASDLPVFREVAGDIPTFLDPNDTGAWEAAVRSFSKDSPERASQLARMAKYQPPTWDDHFRTVEDWLDTL